MPLYRFHCKQCGEDFEFYLRISEAGEGQSCPLCRSKETERTEDSSGCQPADGVCAVKNGPQGTT